MISLHETFQLLRRRLAKKGIPCSVVPSCHDRPIPNQVRLFYDNDRSYTKVEVSRYLNTLTPHGMAYVLEFWSGDRLLDHSLIIVPKDCDGDKIQLIHGAEIIVILCGTCPDEQYRVQG